MVYPLPAVKLAGLVVATAPSNKSPFEVVATVPLFGEDPVPSPMAVTSRELDVATPEYSRIAKRNGPETVWDTVTVLPPPLIFCT